MWTSDVCSAKILLIVELRSSQSSGMGSQRIRILILINKGYRAHTCTILEMSELAAEGASASRLEYETRTYKPSTMPSFICHVGACGFVSRQSTLIAWHNAFKQKVLPVSVKATSVQVWCMSKVHNPIFDSTKAVILAKDGCCRQRA